MCERGFRSSQFIGVNAPLNVVGDSSGFRTLASIC